KFSRVYVIRMLVQQKPEIRGRSVSCSESQEHVRVVRPETSEFSIGNPLDHQHFEVRSHHPIDANRPRDSVKLVQIQAAASSCLDERFEDDIHAHLITESEAVGYGSGHTRHLDSLALDAMLLDSKIEQRRRNPCEPQ